MKETKAPIRKLFQRVRLLRERGLYRNFPERTGLDDLFGDMSTKFDHQDQFVESVGVADPEAQLLRNIKTVWRN